MWVCTCVCTYVCSTCVLCMCVCGCTLHNYAFYTSFGVDIHRLSNLSSLLVDAHPKLIGLPANLVFCQSLSVLGIEG